MERDGYGHLYGDCLYKFIYFSQKGFAIHRRTWIVYKLKTKKKRLSFTLFDFFLFEINSPPCTLCLTRTQLRHDVRVNTSAHCYPKSEATAI